MNIICIYGGRMYPTFFAIMVFFPHNSIRQQTAPISCNDLLAPRCSFFDCEGHMYSFMTVAVGSLVARNLSLCHPLPLASLAMGIFRTAVVVPYLPFCNRRCGRSLFGHANPSIMLVLAKAISVRPSYHICPEFSIPPSLCIRWSRTLPSCLSLHSAWNRQTRD